MYNMMKKLFYAVLILSPYFSFAQVPNNGQLGHDGTLIHTRLRIDSGSKKIDSPWCTIYFGREKNEIEVEFQRGGEGIRFRYDTIINKGSVVRYRGRDGGVTILRTPSGKRKTPAIFVRVDGRKLEFY
jgi:hypothetical protein